ncbi:ribonuclease BN [Streptomyces sp. NRRL B-3648]|uniref:ribonuclease BN n=1 Tax=Streptomyces sp. NRRL B-3648 TaxID=1519493 RepID=UPI000A8CFC15|nr:ribonuclease BN [Streptomyces sp. NRRL B-3648]
MRRLRRGLHRAWEWLRLRALFEHGKELELMHRAMGFATLALVTLAPLLIVVAAADPLVSGGFASWLTDGMGLSGRSAHVITDVISPPRKVIGTTSALSGILLAVFGVSFGGSVQNAYERIWDLASGPWHRVWRQATWLVVLTAYLYQEVATKSTLHGTQRALLSTVSGILFFWWGQRFLLGGQVHWRSLLPGALATVIGLAGLRAFSYLVFTPLIVTNALSYGPVGTVLVVESWLIGVGFVIYGGAVFGRWFTEHHWMPSHHEDGPAGPAGEEQSATPA